jgi:hypothetical protein
MKNLESQLSNLDADTLSEIISSSKKFCSSCMFLKPELGGEIVVSKNKAGTKRWRCAQCKARSSVQRYGSKDKGGD